MTYWRRCKVWCVLEDSHIAPMECSEVQPQARGSMPKLYADRDLMALGEHYPRHVQAMTAEQLHDKSAIAAELAWRDQRLEAISRIVHRALACGQLEKLEDARRYLSDPPAHQETLACPRGCDGPWLLNGQRCPTCKEVALLR